MMGGAVVPAVPVVCTGLLKYRGRNLSRRHRQREERSKGSRRRRGTRFLKHGTLGVGTNEYYKSEEEYFHALALELSKEYRTIVASGILVQVDDPFLSEIFVDPRFDDRQKKRRAAR